MTFIIAVLLNQLCHKDILNKMPHDCKKFLYIYPDKRLSFLLCFLILVLYLTDEDMPLHICYDVDDDGTTYNGARAYAASDAALVCRSWSDLHVKLLMDPRYELATVGLYTSKIETVPLFKQDDYAWGVLFVTACS